MPQVGVLPRQSSIISGVVAPGAVLRFYQTGTSTPQNAYTDAALSNAVTSLTADSAGLFAKWYLNPNAAADYRYTLETSAGSVYYTEDNISRYPIPQDEIGAALYPRTTAEIAASVTPTNYAYPFGHVHRYGAVGDGSTDDTSAIQTAYLAVGAGGGGAIEFEAKTYRFSALNFDGLLNARFRGKSGGNVGNTSVGDFANATVLRSTTTSGNAIEFEGSGYTSKSVVFEDILIHAATVGYVLSFDNVSDIHWVRCKIVNDGSGNAHGIRYSRCYYVNHGPGTMVVKGQNPRSGTSRGVTLDMGAETSFLGGQFNFSGGSSIQSFQTGLMVGDDSPSVANENYANVNYDGELLSCDTGAYLAYGTKAAKFKGAYIEANTSIGIFVTLGARGVSVDSCYFLNPTASDSDIRFGQGGGDAAYQDFYNCEVRNCVFAGVNIRGVTVSGRSSSFVAVENNHFTLSTSGAVGINSNGVYCRSDENTFSGFVAANEHQGTFAVPMGNPGIRTFAAADTTPTVSRAKVCLTDSGSYSITNFDDGVAGQEITVISGGATTFDTTSSNLFGSSADLVTAAGDITTWVCQNATTWWLKGFVDVSVNNSAGA